MFVKAKKLFPFMYILFLLIAFLFVRYVLSKNLVDVQSVDRKKEHVEEVKPIKVSVEIYVAGKLVNQYEKVKMTNQNTINDLLDELYNEKNFKYEKTDYTYGSEFDMIDGTNATSDYKWLLFENNDDITHATKGRLLKDNYIYKFTLAKVTK